MMLKKTEMFISNACQYRDLYDKASVMHCNTFLVTVYSVMHNVELCCLQTVICSVVLSCLQEATTAD